MAYVSFNKSTTRLNAKTSGIAGKVYFTNDSPTIVLDGKEYGITAEQLNALENMSTLVADAQAAALNAEAFMYSILGTLDNITEGTITSSEAQALEALIATKASAADLSGKIDKPSSATRDNIAIFNNSKNVIDGGLPISMLARKLSTDDTPVSIYCDTSIGSDDIFVDAEKSINVEAGRGVKVTIDTDEYPACILDSNNNILAYSVNHIVSWINNTNATVNVKPGVIGTTDFGTMCTYTLGTNDSIRNLKELIDACSNIADLGYIKPNSGIPLGDLTAGILTSLGKADTALQEAYVIVDIGTQSGFYGNYPTGQYNIYTQGVNVYNSINTIWNANKIPVLSVYLASHGTSFQIPLYKTSPTATTFIGNVDLIGNYSVFVSIGTSSGIINTYAFYKKGNANIPKTDLAYSVQTSLDKADSALQEAFDEVNIGTLTNFVEDSSGYPSGYYTISEATAYSDINSIWEESKIPILSFSLQEHTSSYSIPLYKSYDSFYAHERGDNDNYTVDVLISESLSRVTIKVIGGYTKPGGGIPKTDLASAVQTSLNKADTALLSLDIAEMITVGNTIKQVVVDDTYPYGILGSI